MIYLRIENDIVLEIIPEYDPDLPDVPISQRYSAEFVSSLYTLDDNQDVQLNWLYNPETDTFSPPPPPDPDEPEPIPPEQLPTWQDQQKQISLLSQQVDALQKQNTFYEDLFMEIAEIIYV